MRKSPQIKFTRKTIFKTELSVICSFCYCIRRNNYSNNLKNYCLKLFCLTVNIGWMALAMPHGMRFKSFFVE